VTIDDLAALDRVLIESRIGEGPLEWPDAVARAVAAREREFGRIGRAASRAAGVAAAVSASLAPFRDADRASAQVGAIAATIRRFETPPMRDAQAGGGERHLRARGAVLSTLDALARAYAAHDDHPRPADQVAAAILHWIARQTFTPRRGTTGVHLVDAVAARFGAFDHVHLVGLVDAEWPERQRRSVFYTTAFLGKLGWPTDDAHLRSEQAAFRDLVRLPSATLSLTAFQLEGEAVVAATPLTDEARALERREIEVPASRLFADERLAWAPPAVDGLPSGTAAWLALRTERPDQAGPEYRGQVGTLPPREYRVSQLDQFALCAFKYFAGAVLRLDEEPDADAALTPRERGNLLHGIFETFYREWQEAGHGAITSANMAQAIDRFEAIVQDRLALLPEADRIIESSRLLGSIVMRGVAERVFSEEVKDGRAVERRELEVALHGTYAFPPQGFAPAPSIAIRGVADRIDRMADGTLRLVDYKLTRAPSDSAVQLKVYAHAAGQKFGSVETPAVVSRAEYISFGDDREAVRSIVARNSTMEQSVLAGAQKFAEYVGAVEGGRFAPAPEKASLCAWCAYALVCRKEVVERDGDDGADDGEADAAESV
jgi:RecB family exonuclease